MDAPYRLAHRGNIVLGSLDRHKDVGLQFENSEVVGAIRQPFSLTI